MKRTCQFPPRSENAREEGVEFKFNVQPLGIEVNGNGKVSGVKMVRTEMGEPDAKGRRRAEIVAGSEHIVPADAVIMAFGFRPHSMEWLAKHSVELDSQGRIIAPKATTTLSRPATRKSLLAAISSVVPIWSLPPLPKVAKRQTAL